MKIIVTPDSGLDTAFIYDNTIYKIKRVEALNSVEHENKGRNSFRPFGIDYDNNYIYIVSHNKVGRFLKDSYKFVDTIINLESKLNVNTHLIRKVNNTFYVANTATDVLAIISDKFEKYIHIPTRQILNKPLNCVDAYDKDTVHLNSFCIKDNLLYYCLHNKRKQKSKYEVIDLVTYNVKHIVDAGWCSHGVEIINNILYSLSSATGELIEHCLINNITRYYKLVNPEETFLRGLDKIDNTLYIGCSNNHDHSIINNNCFIATFNTNNKEVKRILELNEMTIITDLRVIQ